MDNPVVTFLDQFIQAHPILALILAVLGFPEVIILVVVAILVAQFGVAVTQFIKNALQGFNPWEH